MYYIFKLYRFLSSLKDDVGSINNNIPKDSYDKFEKSLLSSDSGNVDKDIKAIVGLISSQINDHDK